MKRIGIIGYGSMGKMILQKFSESDSVNSAELRIASRALTKIEKAPEEYLICRSNTELARASDVIFICTRPVDIIAVLEEIAAGLNEEALIISLNSSITLDSLEKICKRKYAIFTPKLYALSIANQLSYRSRHILRKGIPHGEHLVSNCRMLS